MKQLRLILPAILVAVVCFEARPVRGGDQVLLSDDFARRPPGLITNQFAFLHPSDPNARKDTIWEVTSGSFFADRGSGFSGVPDDVTPNARSTNGSGSAVFHALSNENDINNATMSFDLQTVALFDSTGVAPKGSDGVSVILRYKSDDEYYAVNVNRRDNTVTLEKKIAFRSNTSALHEIGSAPYALRRNAVVGVDASIQTQRDGSVLIILSIDGARVLRVRDEGLHGGAIIHGPGRIGMFATNCEFYVRRLKVSALPTP